MLSFEHPHLFWLAPLPLLAWRLLPPARRQSLALWVPFFDSWEPLQERGRSATHRRPLTLALLAAIWLALLAAASRPNWLGEPIQQQLSGREMLLAVDLSESMTIEDMALAGQSMARIDAVKAVLSEFIMRRQGDKVGLVLFGSKAYYHVPLTFDLDTLRTLLLEAQPGFAGKYTAIGDAIGLAVKRLVKRPESSRVVVLLTDGANTAGTIEPIKAAELGAAAGIRIYTIGVGSGQETLMPSSPLGGGRYTFKPTRGTVDDKLLSYIAETTNGRYFRARDTEELESIYGYIDELEKTEIETTVFKRYEEQFARFLLFGLFLLLLETVLRYTVLKTVP